MFRCEGCECQQSTTTQRYGMEGIGPSYCLCTPRSMYSISSKVALGTLRYVLAMLSSAFEYIDVAEGPNTNEYDLKPFPQM